MVLPNPNLGRYRRLALSMVSGVGSQVVSLGAPIVALPVMLHRLGDVDFGIWAASVSFTSVTAFLDLGIGSCLLTRLAAAFATKSHAEVRQYLASAYSVLGVVAAAGVVIVLTMTASGFGALVVPIGSWPIVVAVLLSFFVGMPAVVSYRVLYSSGKIPLQNILQSFGALLSVVGCLLAVHAQETSVVVVGTYCATPVLVQIVTTLWIFLKNPDLRLRKDDFRKAHVRSLLGFGSSFFVLSILTAVGTNTDILLISALAGPEAAAQFVPPARVGSILGILVTQMFMPLWTLNGEALAQGDISWVRRTTAGVSVWGAAGVAVFGVVILGVLDNLMVLWMHRSFLNQHLVFGSIVVLSAITAFTSPYNMALNAKGLAGSQIGPWLAFVVLSIGAKLAFVRPNSAWTAPAISAVFYLLLVTPFMVTRARRLFSESL